MGNVESRRATRGLALGRGWRWFVRFRRHRTLATVADQADCGATAHLHLALLAALRGTIFLYQGEELGLPQSELAFEDLQDPFGKAHWPQQHGP